MGSESNWAVPVWGRETTTHKSELLVVRLLSEEGADVLQAEWNGGLGQMYWQQAIATDFSDLVEQDYALSVVARIDEKPKKSVDLKMDCGYPCGGALNMTKRTLHRKLSEHGESFRSLLEGVRRNLVTGYLGDAELTLTEIAFLLGFSDSSSFSRAYRRWFETTPSAARAGLTLRM